MNFQGELWVLTVRTNLSEGSMELFIPWPAMLSGSISHHPMWSQKESSKSHPFSEVTFSAASQMTQKGTKRNRRSSYNQGHWKE